jgi:hypothetical protein
MPCAIGQNEIIRGHLTLTEHPEEIQNIIGGDSLNLQDFRNSIDFLTNMDITSHLGYPIKKRKKAFRRHIKHLSEKVEWHYYNKKSLNPEIIEIIYEIVLFEQSFKQAAIDDNQTMGTFKQKYGMYKSYKKSKRLFTYYKPKQQPIPNDPTESPFWHMVQDSLIGKQFDILAKQKKIKTKKRMVVLFDELSFGGSAPKVRTMDLDYDNEWSLKWGDEVHTDVLGSRIFAGLGYDVDHPYYYGKDKLTLVFDGNKSIKNVLQMADSLKLIYEIDITHFISSHGIITKEMATDLKRLKPFVGCQYARFKKCAIEARPDRVKRIGPILPNRMNNHLRMELRGALLAHAFIGNWDTRPENTRLTTVHNGNYEYRMSAVFTDLGTSLGVKMTTFPADFKVGLVNELEWEVVEIKSNKIRLTNQINSILKPFEDASYEDLHWMAGKIAKINEKQLRRMVKKAGWPQPIAELYFHKMASRRASIIEAFKIEDPHPIAFDKNLTVVEDGVTIIRNGELVVDYDPQNHPESFLSKKGRERGYGN